jgi:hypothetical protein
LLLAVVAALTAPTIASPSEACRIDHVTDGDTLVLGNGERVR